MHFNEYINDYNYNFLNINKNEILKNLFSNFNFNAHLIFYGPSGIGKYSLVLSILKNLSPTQLKYEKKIIINFNRNDYYFKISDIHYEVDMAILGCNSKILWHEIFNKINDSVLISTSKKL